MFDFSSGELLLIAVAALVFIKPKDLPGALRVVGQWTGKIRRMAGEFQDQFREAMREAEMADIKRDVDEATSKFTGADPFADIQRAVEWKSPESTGTSAGPAGAPAPGDVPPPDDVPAPADVPPAPPAEAIVAAPAAAPPAAPAEPGAQADVTQGDSAPPPAGGDRRA